MTFDNELEIPFDVLKLDGCLYAVPHGLHVDAEPFLKEGIFEIELENRNVTLSPLLGKDADRTCPSLPSLPADEFLVITGTRDKIVIYSKKVMAIQNITINSMYDFYSKYDRRLDDVDPSQLTVKHGRLCIGSIAEDRMVIVWTGTDFIVTPAASKLNPGEETVCETEGAIASQKFRCKYGMLDYRP